MKNIPKRCPACGRTGKDWKTTVMKGTLIRAKCERCKYSMDRTKGIKCNGCTLD